MTKPLPRFTWHADSYDSSLASIRYRLDAPLAALAARGVSIDRHDRAAESTDAILFCKSHGKQALEIAERARATGRTIVYDLCDNLFAAHRAGHVSVARLERHRRILSLADHIVFATPALAEQIARELPGGTAHRHVVPDVLDTGPPVLLDRPTALERWELKRLDRFLARHATALHCVWFGKSLGRESGYAHLDLAVSRLADHARPVTLTVVSNARVKLWRAAARWPVPVHYMPWRLATSRVTLARHRLAIVPVGLNDYTTGKTINRPATAILAGLGVVADAIPSYEELRPYIALGDWPGGLDDYARWDATTQARLADARAMLTGRYGQDAVAAQWQAVLDTVRAS